MIKDIKILNGFGFFTNREPFILTQNESLSIQIPKYLVGNILIVKLGDSIEKYKLTSDTFVIPNLSVGTLELAISIIHSGEEIRRYSIEPLLIKEINSEIKAIPQISELELQISKYKKDYEDIVNKMSGKVSTLTKLVGIVAETDINMEEN